jgi:hypothetical protein
MCLKKLPKIVKKFLKLVLPNFSASFSEQLSFPNIDSYVLKNVSGIIHS